MRFRSALAVTLTVMAAPTFAATLLYDDFFTTKTVQQTFAGLDTPEVTG